MKSTDIPSPFNLVFARDADGSHVRTVPDQPGSDPAAASLSLGFPPVTFTPEGAGGTPPSGLDMNGILRLLSAWSRWTKAGGAVPFDATWAAAVGGYPKSARVAGVATPGRIYVSTVDNNLKNPESAGATGWVVATDEGHSYNANNGYVTVGQLIVNFGQNALTDSSGHVDVTFAKPFPNGALFPMAVNASGPGFPSSWPGCGNLSKTGMRVGMSAAPAGGGSGVAAGAGTSAYWLCGGW